MGIGYAAAHRLSALGAKVVSWDIDPSNAAWTAPLESFGTAVTGGLGDYASVSPA